MRVAPTRYREALARASWAAKAPKAKPRALGFRV